MDRRSSSVLAATLAGSLLLSPRTHAFVLIDDFTVGDYHRVLEWPNSGDSHQKFNLDQNHARFGERQSVFNVSFNPDQVPVSLDIGGGEAKISSPKVVFFDWRINFGLDNLPAVDFTNDPEIWIDYYTKDPAGLLPDSFTLSAVDTSGQTSTATGFLTRPGGVKFTRQAFNGNVDWSRVRSFQFIQEWNSFPNPLTYSLTKIYAVPEPTSFVALALGGGLLACRRRSKAR